MRIEDKRSLLLLFVPDAGGLLLSVPAVAAAPLLFRPLLLPRRIKFRLNSPKALAVHEGIMKHILEVHIDSTPVMCSTPKELALPVVLRRHHWSLFMLGVGAQFTRTARSPSAEPTIAATHTHDVVQDAP